MTSYEKRDHQVFTDVKDICFPVEKRPYNGVANSDYEFDVIATIDGVERRLNSCAERYELAPNDEIFPAIEAELYNANVEFDVTYEMTNFAVFTATYKLYHIAGRNLAFKISDNDEIFPQLTVRHSYNGLAKYAFVFGYFRMVCENGLTIPVEGKEEDNFSVTGKHTKVLFKANLDQLNETLQRFLKVQDDLLPRFEKLQKNVWTGQAHIKRIEKVMDACNISTGRDSKKEGEGKAKLGKVVEIAEKEAKKLSTPMNDWLIYNAINNFIFDNEENRKTNEVRQANDQKVLAYMLKNDGKPKPRKKATPKKK